MAYSVEEEPNEGSSTVALKLKKIPIMVVGTAVKEFRVLVIICTYTTYFSTCLVLLHKNKRCSRRIRQRKCATVIFSPTAKL